MFRFRSSNAAIANLARTADAAVVDRASYRGVAFKAIYMSVLTMISAVVFGVLFINNLESTSNSISEFLVWALSGAAIIAFIFAMIAAMIPSSTPITGSVYCVLQGLVMGVISAVLEYIFPGVALMALLSTVGIFTLMMVLYCTGTIKVGRFLQSFVLSALLGVVLFSLIAGIVAMFNPAARDAIFGDSLFALVISAILVVVASLMILIDLKTIDDTVKMGLDRKYEWRAAFGLIITLIWLYLEVLRLFAIIASRNNK